MRALTLLTALPLGVFLLSVVLLARRARQLLILAPVDSRALAERLRELVARADFTQAIELSRELRPSWAAMISEQALQAHAQGEAVEIVTDDLVADLREREANHYLGMRTLGRAAFPLALAVAIVELGRGFSGDSGLLSLQRGLAESTAVERAAFAIACGFAASMLAQLGLRLQQRQSRELLAGIKRVTDVLRTLDATREDTREDTRKDTREDTRDA
jgi:hypothetical protein